MRKYSLFFAFILIIFSCFFASAQTPISNCTALQEMNLTTTGRFYLTQNIDCAGVAFVPIGVSPSFFNGSLNGSGYVISNLRVPTADGNGGLFAGLRAGANVTDLGLKNISITVGGGGLAGALAGSAGVTNIVNVYATGSVTGDWVGAEYVGGLVGDLFAGGVITNSYSFVNVTGFVGVGGLVGRIWANAVVNQSYAAGNVSGTTPVGGLIAVGDAALVNASFWDANTSRQVNSSNGTGLSTTNMKNFTIYSNALWNISLKRNHDGKKNTSIWLNDNTYDYPRLWFEYSTLPDFVPPTIAFNDSTEGNATTLTTGNINVNVSVDEDVEIDSVYIRLFNSSFSLINSTSNLTLNKTGHVSFTFSGLEDGVYYFNATVNDTSAYNVSTVTRTVTVSIPVLSPETTAEEDGGSFDIFNAASVEGGSFSLKNRDIVNLDVEGGKHTLRLNSFNLTSAHVTIKSEPQTVYLDLLKNFTFDLNKNSFDDTLLRYEGVVNGRAKLFIKYLDEDAVVDETEDNYPDLADKDFNYLIILISTALLLVLIILIIYFRAKHMRVESKKS